MDKRFQVFVSSTYEDLQEERREVMQALLELDCIPAGMELFPAADETQWSLIRRVIDDCDYYIVIVGGRYGSVGADGISYTQMEYRHALDQGKPIIAFLHKDPSSLTAKRTESTTAGRAKLEAFRALCQQKLIKHWTSPADLGSVVSRSLVRLMKDRPALGWIRADAVADTDVLEELVRKTKRIEELEASLAATRTEAPPGTENLASGAETFMVHFAFVAHDASKPYLHRDTAYKAIRAVSWDQLFASLCPHMIDEASEAVLRSKLNEFLKDSFAPDLRKEKAVKGLLLDDFRITDTDFQTIKVQLTALGLIVKSKRSRSVKDTATYWTLTPYGEQRMIQLRAVTKQAASTK